MSVRPIKDWVRMTAEPPKQTTAGGIFLTHGERVLRGTIKALGPKAGNSGLKVGDVAVFFRENLETQSGKQVTARVRELSNGEVLVRASSLLFVLEDPGVDVR